MSNDFYSPFKSAVYRFVWLAMFFSNVGTWAHTVTSSLVMTQLTTSSTLIALVQTFAMLPVFLFAIPAGVLADLYDRRNIIIGAQIIMSLLALLMACCVYVGYMSPALLLAMTFLLNIGFAFNQPAWQAFASTLIPTQDIKQAAALNNLSFNISRCIGPAIAGFYFSKLGPGPLFLLNSVSFVGVILMLKFKTISQPDLAKKVNFKQAATAFKETFNFINEYPLLKNIILKSSTYFLLASCFWAALPYIIITYHHMGNSDLGLLISGAGIGAVLNALYLQKLRKKWSENSLTACALLFTGIVMLFFNMTNSLVNYFGLMIIFGVAWSLSISIFNGNLQADFPQHIRSRLIGLYYVFFALSQVIGSYVCGNLIQAFGLNLTMLVLSIISISMGFYWILSHPQKGELLSAQSMNRH